MYSFSCWIIIYLTLTYPAASVTYEEEIAGEFCFWESFKANCPSSTVMVITNAFYTRAKVNKCIKSSSDVAEGVYDATEVISSECSGRRSCEVKVIDENLITSARDCGLMCYLQVRHICISVAESSPNSCSSLTPLILKDNSNTISSAVADNNHCGPDVRWKIEATPGQQINLSITDFGAPDEADPTNITAHKVQRCIPYGFITEKATRLNKTICGGVSRKNFVLSSNSHTLEITILTARQRHGKHFLLHYQLTGCPDFDSKDNLVYKREADIVTVTCKSTEQSWRLVCKGREWKGVVGNCSQTEQQPPMMLGTTFQFADNRNLLILIGLAAVIIVLVLIAIIGCILLLRKPAPSNNRERNMIYDKALAEEYYRRSLVATQGRTLNWTASQRPDDVDCIHIWESPLPEPLISTNASERFIPAEHRTTNVADSSLMNNTTQSFNSDDRDTDSEHRYYVLEQNRA